MSLAYVTAPTEITAPHHSQGATMQYALPLGDAVAERADDAQDLSVPDRATNTDDALRHASLAQPVVAPIVQDIEEEEQKARQIEKTIAAVTTEIQTKQARTRQLKQVNARLANENATLSESVERLEKRKNALTQRMQSLGSRNESLRERNAWLEETMGVEHIHEEHRIQENEARLMEVGVCVLKQIESLSRRREWLQREYDRIMQMADRTLARRPELKEALKMTATLEIHTVQELVARRDSLLSWSEWNSEKEEIQMERNLWLRQQRSWRQEQIAWFTKTMRWQQAIGGIFQTKNDWLEKRNALLHQKHLEQMDEA
ncbi:hypothetical protein FN846DRAFT_908393 [Sphaerosporella brunnea]|uniref:Uncharacterized protein n=1 Tax=Sphaerosporella brunnea TaxID=1250544 RepID=A0A5J5ETS7_9PEZI|nr:hypothetical protein FN846DRAFT_908393 [Sphaerosporella brunnea]